MEVRREVGGADNVGAGAGEANPIASPGEALHGCGASPGVARQDPAGYPSEQRASGAPQWPDTAGNAMRPQSLLVTAFAILLSACSDPAPDLSHLPPDRRVETRYAATLRVDLSAMEARPSGLFLQDLGGC